MKHSYDADFTESLVRLVKKQKETIEELKEEIAYLERCLDDLIDRNNGNYNN